MNKLFTKIVGACLGLTMAVGVGVAVASNSEAVSVHAATIGTNLVQVTSLTSGNQYVIAGNDNGYALPTNPTLSSGKVAGTAIASVPANGSGYLWTFTKSGDYWLIGDGSNYIYHSNGGGSGTNLAYGTSTTYKWKLTYSASTQSHWTFKGVNNTTENSRGMLVNGTNFGGYALANESSYKFMNIYEVVTAKEVTGITKTSSPSKTSYFSGTAFDPTGLEIQITYSSGDPDTITYVGNESDFTWTPETITAAGNVSIQYKTYSTMKVTQAVTLATVTSVTSVNSSPASVAKNGTVDPSEVILNVGLSNGESTTVEATSITLDTSVAKNNVQGTAYYNSVGSATFIINVLDVVQYSLYSGALTAGDYIICAGTNALKNTVTSAPRLNAETVTITNNKITDPDASIVWHISVDSDDNTYWNIYNADVEKYAAFTGTDGRGTLIQSITDYGRWQCTGTSTYQFTNKGKTGKYLRYNAGYGFASYANNMGPDINLYKAPETGFNVTTTTEGLSLDPGTIGADGGQITLTTGARLKGTNVQVSNTATSSVSGNVVSLTNVTGDVTINATIGAATPTLSVSGQKTLFTLTDSWSFGGTVKLTYDDWCDPHTVDTLDSGYTVNHDNFVAGVAGTYSISISYTGAQPISYDVTVADIQEKTDLLNLEAFNATGTSSYSNHNAIGSNSKTSYIGCLMANSTNMQLRSSSSDSGIVSINTKGVIGSITVTVAGNNTNTYKIYGKNEAYSAPTDLYGNAEAQGTELFSGSTTQTFDFTALDDDYTYIGFRSSSGALYITSIEITWYVVPKTVHHITASTVTEEGPFYVGEKPTLAQLGVTVEAYYDEQETDHEDVTALASVTYPSTGLTVGTNNYTVTYGGQSANISITAITGDVYVKLNTVTDLIVGSTIRIGTNSYGMTSSSESSQLAYVEGDPSVASLANVVNLTVGADKDGYYFYYEDSGNHYLTCSAANQLSFGTQLGSTSHWNVSITSEGVARITISISDTTYYLKNNNSSHRFACFASGQTDISIYQLVDSEMTEAEKTAAEIDTFAKLYLHKIDIIDNETTRQSDTTTCNDYYTRAKAALSGEWSPIQEDFSNDTTGMWLRYCNWAWATAREVPTFSDGEISYSNSISPLVNIIGENTNTVAIIVVISMISITAVGGYFLLRRRKEVK